MGFPKIGPGLTSSDRALGGATKPDLIGDVDETRSCANFTVDQRLAFLIEIT
jgi:hypothetical protein